MKKPDPVASRPSRCNLTRAPARRVRRGQRQQTAEFKAAYAARAGVEGTISAAVGAHEMRRARYMGQDKTHLQHILTAVAINLSRLFAWWEEKPRARTRSSPFAALAAA